METITTGEKTMKVANKNASEYVNKCEIFEGSNTFSEFKVQYDDKLYVVYSYGYHFPMYIYDYQVEQCDTLHHLL